MVTNVRLWRPFLSISAWFIGFITPEHDASCDPAGLIELSICKHRQYINK